MGDTSTPHPVTAAPASVLDYNSGMTDHSPERPADQPGPWLAEVIDEPDLSCADRTAAGELLARAFDYAGYRATGHRGAVPEFRVLIRGRDGDDIGVLGHRSAFRLANDREIVAYGMGDAAVHPGARRQGIATRLVDAGIDEARRRGAAAILTFTEPLAGLYRRRGFRPAGQLIVAADLPDYVDLALLWLADGVEPPSEEHPLRVDPGDF